MRSAAIFAVAVVLACEVTPDEGVSVSGPGGGGSAPDDGGETGDDDDAATEGTAASTGADGSASAGDSSGADADTGMATFEPDDGSSSDGAADSEGAGETMGGAAEDGGAYAPCESSADCFADPGLACLKSDDNGANGFCSPACGTMGQSPPDAQLCPPAPDGVTAIKVCVEGFVRNCALSCAGDLTCPEGTACLPANGGGGPYCYGI
jgi:hypothetical protein